jgi:hypothetical protein
MASSTQQDFVPSLLAEFPELRDAVENCDGQLLNQMEAFAQFTQAAKTGGDMETYGRCVNLAERLFAAADGTLGSAFRMAYLEHLEFEGSRGPDAWRLLPPRLQSVWQQIAAENRRLQSLPQKHGGQRSHGPDAQGNRERGGGGSGGGGGGGRKRPPRRGRRR